MPSTRIVIQLPSACAATARRAAVRRRSGRRARLAAVRHVPGRKARRLAVRHLPGRRTRLAAARHLPGTRARLAAAFAIFLIAAAAASSAAAQPADVGAPPNDTLSHRLGAPPNDTLSHRLGEITVTASRLDVAAGEAAQRITVLDRTDIEHSGARTLADLLESRAGLFVRRYGEGLATLTLRGASPSQTLILLDGLRLSDPQLGQIDLSLLPTHVLDAVEVLHGPGSALYGSDGVGGVINLRPHRPGGSSARLTSEIGAFGERRVGGTASFSGRSAGVAVSAEFAGADGDFPYLNEALFPAREMRRRNADRSTRSLYASGFALGRGHRLRAGVLYADADRGLPGLATVAPTGERQWDEHVRFWVSDEIRLRPGTLALRGFIHRGALRYGNPGLGIDDTGRTLAGGVEGEIAAPVGGRWIADAGLSAGFARAEHPSLSADAAEATGSVFGEIVGRLGRVTLYPALRLDAFSGGFRDAPAPAGADTGVPAQGRAGGDPARAAVSPRLGVNVRLADAPAIRLKAAAGRSFRHPTFNERYWQPGGNPDLRPERGWSGEVGLYAAWVLASIEATVFAARTRNQILWMPDGRGIWTPENLARTGSTGIEASVRAASREAGSPAGGLRVDGGATYTFTRAVDRSEPGTRTYGRQLRYVPRHQIKGFAGASLGPVRVDAATRLIGRRFVTADETESLPAALVVDLQAGIRRAAGPIRLSLSVVVENLLDRDYALIRHYPMPPRHARIRLSAEFR